jgi:hypothetical protein
LLLQEQAPVSLAQSKLAWRDFTVSNALAYYSLWPRKDLQHRTMIPSSIGLQKIIKKFIFWDKSSISSSTSGVDDYTTNLPSLPPSPPPSLQSSDLMFCPKLRRLVVLDVSGAVQRAFLVVAFLLGINEATHTRFLLRSYLVI